jgi:uncharacterized protein with PIN domain
MTPRFLCDAMLGGLSRWLRAAGYDASFEYGIDDGALVRRAAEQDRIVLSSDGGVFERNVIKSGTVRALFVPRAVAPVDQLFIVLRSLRLEPREPRCMACGGELSEVAKHEVRDSVPPRSFAAHDEFWRCAGCRKLYWHGTHWTHISSVLGRRAAVARPRGAGDIVPEADAPRMRSSVAGGARVEERRPLDADGRAVDR